MAAAVRFGQVIIGPPGSGKSTYCRGIRQFYEEIGRPVAIVNLDPANDFLPYKCDVDLSELVSLERVMETMQLGPNGGLVYCMEFLEQNLDWLERKLSDLGDAYLLFDCPGQVELYTHHPCFRRILDRLQKWKIRLAAVHLVDSHYCSDPAKYMSVLLLSLQTMLQLELPHVNVLSKMDLLEQYGKLAFNLSFYTEVQDTSRLVEALDEDTFGKRFIGLNRALGDLVEDYALLSFQTLRIHDKRSVGRLVQLIDKANGFMYGAYDARKDEYMRPGALGAALDEADELAEGFNDSDEDAFDYTGARQYELQSDSDDGSV